MGMQKLMTGGVSYSSFELLGLGKPYQPHKNAKKQNTWNTLGRRLATGPT